MINSEFEVFIKENISFFFTNENEKVGKNLKPNLKLQLKSSSHVDHFTIT